MKSWKLVALLSALLLAVPARAQDEPFPAPIQKDLAEATKECADYENGKITVNSGFVRKLDLTGNKRADYIVDQGKLKCSSFETPFCGTGGCHHFIYVTTKSGELKQVFSGMVRGYKISKGAGAKTITFHLHGGFCGQGGYYDCVKKRRITEQPFEFKDR